MSTAEAVSIAARELYPAGINPWLIALTVTLATFMEVLDTSIANVALPHIAGGLGASTDESTWMLTSYLVSNAIVLPISGWISSIIGRKRFYMVCVCPFHGQFIPVRTGAQPGDADFLSRSAGRRRRRPAAQRASDSGGYVRAREARHGVRGIRDGRCGRASDWPDAGRLDYRQL